MINTKCEFPFYLAFSATKENNNNNSDTNYPFTATNKMYAAIKRMMWVNLIYIEENKSFFDRSSHLHLKRIRRKSLFVYDNNVCLSDTPSSLRFHIKRP